MPQIGPLEIAVVLLVALLVFGPNRMPELARQAGRAMRELRRIQQNLRADLHELVADEPTGAAPPPTLPPKADGGGDEPEEGTGIAEPEGDPSDPPPPVGA
ncbi:MAG: twin-arginine translocase TatA/TatE family subunit [Actinomycetota bacterium]